MKKINKVLLAVTLIFSLFMMYGEVNAAEASACTSKSCSVIIEKVENRDSLLVDVYYGEWANIYSISVAKNGDEYYVNNTFNIEINNNNPDAINAIHDFVPVAGAGDIRTKVSNYGTSYYIYHVADETSYTIENDFNIIGYLVIDSEFSDTEFYSSFISSDVFNGQSAELTLDGIKYSDRTNSYIQTDFFFGDFRYTYEVTTFNAYDFELDMSKYTGGSFVPVNANSNKVIIDNSKSLLDLNCRFYFSSSSDLKLEVYDTSPVETWIGGVGDAGPVAVLNEFNDYEFITKYGKKKTFNFYVDGGNLETAKDILKNGGHIGSLSLFISTY